jgi:integrase
LRVGEARNI